VKGLYIFGTRTLIVDVEIFFFRKKVKKSIFSANSHVGAKNECKFISPKDYPTTVFVTQRPDAPKKRRYNLTEIWKWRHIFIVSTCTIIDFYSVSWTQTLSIHLDVYIQYWSVVHLRHREYHMMVGHVLP